MVKIHTCEHPKAKIQPLLNLFGNFQSDIQPLESISKAYFQLLASTFKGPIRASLSFYETNQNLFNHFDDFQL